MKIGLFDSGLGGLSVLYEARMQLPGHSFLYYADEEHVPYGEKTRAEILRYTMESVACMVEHGCEAIVIACNTATSAAVQELRASYTSPIISMEPAVKLAFDRFGNRKVLVCATPLTLQGEKLRLLLDRVDTEHLATCLPLPELVRFAEREEFTSKRVTAYLQEQFGKYDLADYSSLVLGCTHFNYFKDTMRSLLPKHIQFVDGNAGTVRQLIHRMHEVPDCGEETSPTLEFFISGKRVEDSETLAMYGRLFDRLKMVHRL